MTQENISYGNLFGHRECDIFMIKYSFIFRVNEIQSYLLTINYHQMILTVHLKYK